MTTVEHLRRVASRGEVSVAGVPWPSYKLIALALGFLVAAVTGLVTAGAAPAVLSGAGVASLSWTALAALRRSRSG